MSRDGEPTFVDLFCGCGGMSLGFEQAGFESLGAIDKDEHATETYAENFGVEPVVGDITEFDAETLLEEFGVDGRPDVVISCAPCQGFSRHRNKHDDVEDDRNSLVSFSTELAVEMEPEFFVMENVPEMIRGSEREHWTRAYAVLKQAGYLVRYGVLSADEYGVPQSRQRAIVVARRGGRKVELPEPMSAETKTVRDAIGDLPSLRPGEQSPDDEMHVAPDHTDRIVEMLDLIPEDGGLWADIPEEYRDEYWLDSMKKRARNGSATSFPDTYGRMEWDEPAPTITRKSSSPSCGRFVHPEQNRNISVREAARLQSFPDEWTFEGPVTSKYAQNGNAVPPALAESIATTILRYGETDEVGTRQLTFDTMAE